MLIGPPYQLKPFEQNGLLSWFPFDAPIKGNFVDATAKNVATLNGTVLYGGGKAPGTNGLGSGAFKGGSDANYLTWQLPTITAVSVLAWVYPNALPFTYNGVQDFLSPQEGELFITNGNKLAVYLGASASVSKDPGTINVPNNAWSHVGFTYDSVVGLNLYVNSVLDSHVAANGALAGTGPSTAYIGRGAGLNRSFGGWIDDLRTYNRALSHAEIISIYAQAFQTLADVEPISMLHGQFAAGGFTPMFRKTLSMYGSGVGKRQSQAA